jgi:hypothetical protein
MAELFSAELRLSVDLDVFPSSIVAEADLLLIANLNAEVKP